MIEEQLGSFLPGEMTDEDFDRLEAEFSMPSPRKADGPVARFDLSKYVRGVDVPIAIGKRR